MNYVTTVAGLTDDEAATLGTWQVTLSRALHEVTGCAKTYVVQFAEKEGFGHVHFHIVPRMPDIPDDRRGAAVVGYLEPPPGQEVSEQHRDDLTAALQARLRA